MGFTSFNPSYGIRAADSARARNRYEDVHRKSVSMGKPSRIFFAIAASICGALTIIIWSAAIYAFVKTPSVSEIILRSNGSTVEVNKAMALFLPSAYQTGLFLITLYPLIRWNHIIGRIAVRASPGDNLGTNGMGRRFPAGALWCVGLCAVSAINLYTAAQRISQLLSQQ
jgi:hypothetical protein